MYRQHKRPKPAIATIEKALNQAELRQRRACSATSSLGQLSLGKQSNSRAKPPKPHACCQSRCRSDQAELRLQSNRQRCRFFRARCSRTKTAWGRSGGRSGGISAGLDHASALRGGRRKPWFHRCVASPPFCRSKPRCQTRGRCGVCSWCNGKRRASLVVHSQRWRLGRRRRLLSWIAFNGVQKNGACPVHSGLNNPFQTNAHLATVSQVRVVTSAPNAAAISFIKTGPWSVAT